MRIHAHKTALILLALLAASSSLAAAYLQGRNRAAGEAATATQAPRTKIMLGKIVGLEPFHLYVESDAYGSWRTYDVLVGRDTMIIQAVPWGTGEKEAAEREYRSTLERMDPKSGDPIPPPPLDMRPAPLDLTILPKGTMVGIRTESAIDPDKPIFALGIRPLLDDEIRSGQVASTFPIR